MNARHSIQLGLGALLFLAGTVLEIGALIGFFSPAVAALLPGAAVATHGAAALLLATGAALVVTSRSPLSQAIGIGLLFLTLGLLLPGVGPLAILGLTIVLCRHAWKNAAAKVALEEIMAAARTSTSGCPVHAPLIGIRHTLPHEDLQGALLGMADMPSGQTRPLLKSLRKHKNVRVLLYANGLLNDHLNFFEKRFAALQDQATRNPDDVFTLTALVETFAALINNKLIPADEISVTTKRALNSADAALRLDPANAPVLAAKARFELLQADFSAAYATIQQLYALPDCFDQARALHAELLFEHAATRPVRKTSGTPVSPRSPQHSLN